MGSFNLSCGISKLPIKRGDEVVFIAISSQKDYRDQKNIKLPNTQMLIHHNDLYDFALFPIIGRYDDYGSIEDIKINSNTRFLEKKYNKSIDEIMSTITNNHSVFNLSNIWDMKIVEGNTIEDFKNLGFEFVNDSKTEMINKDFKIKLDLNSDKVIVNYYNESFKLENYHNLQEEVFEKFELILGIKDINEHYSLKHLYGMGGMFVNKEIYDKMVSVKYVEHEGLKDIQDGELSNGLLDMLEPLVNYVKKEQLNEKQEDDIYEKISEKIKLFFPSETILRNHRHEIISTIIDGTVDINEWVNMNNGLSQFKDSMISTNTLILPSYCGHQYGSIEMTEFLSKETQNIASGIIELEREYNDEPVFDY